MENLSRREHLRQKKMQIHIGNDKYGKYDAGDPIGGHKGQVDPAEIIGFDNGMLVDQHTQKYGHSYPV